MKNRKDQGKLKRWYEKGFWGVYKKTCSVCGSEFYTLFCDQVTCDNKACDKTHRLKNS